jgi:hypothetical protein
MFMEKSLEVRPDVVSVTSWLACLVLLMIGLRRQKADGWRTGMTFAGSGAFLGLGLMASQKIMFVMPGFSVAMLWYLFDPRSCGAFSQRIVNVAAQFAGFCLPILIMAVYLAYNEALEPFIEYALVFNFGWPREFWHFRFTTDLVVQNPVLVNLSLIGLLIVVLRMYRSEYFRNGDYVIAINTIGLQIGLFLLPAPYPQYYMMLIPLMATLAAMTLVDVADTLGRSLAADASGDPDARRIDRVVLAPFRTRDGMLAGIIILISIPSAIWMYEQSKWRNGEDLNEIRFVMDHTSPNDTVMDGWRGVGVFRPHATFFWMLPPTLARRVPPGTWEEVLADLRSCEIAPKIVNIDEFLGQVSPRIQAYFLEHFEPTGVGDIHIRNECRPSSN